MDPYQQQRNQQDNMNQSPNNNSPSDSANRTATDQQQQPQYVGGYTVITPNESRRNNLRTMAQREEEQFQRYREAQRSVPVHVNPERLGGGGTLQEARERQFTDQRCSKLQKKLKREEDERRKKEQEEMEIQKMKDKQREKAERLEQKKQQDDIRRREQFQSDRTRVMDRFLTQYETKASSHSSAPSPIPNAQHAPSVKTNAEERQQDHKRTNAAFLDNIERQMRASNQSRASPSASSSSESLDQESPPRPQTSPAPRRPGEDEPNTDPGPDFDWALMKLMSNFPHFDKDVLEEILTQCSGDYQQAHGLLSLG